MKRAIRAETAFKRAALAGLLLAGAVISLSACNTVAGAGKDVSNAGNATSNTANTVQQKM